MGAPNTLSAGLRHSEVPHLALADQILHGAGDILNGHIGIYPMLIEEIDCIGAQSLQRRVRVLANTFRPAVQSFSRNSFPETEFRRNHHVLAKRLDGLPYHFLLQVWAIGF